MLLQLVLLAIICNSVSGKAFGHTIEYRFEYDPKKSDRPIIEWRYDDLVGRRDASHNHQEQPDIRKAPRKYFSRQSENTSDVAPRGSAPKWMNERIRGTDNRRIENEEFVEEMAAELRRQSEAIIASHFPGFPFDFHRPQYYGRPEWIQY